MKIILNKLLKSVLTIFKINLDEKIKFLLNSN